MPVADYLAYYLRTGIYHHIKLSTTTFIISMNLESRLTDTLNDVLRTSGYIFEIINNNKRQSNLITGPNNQLIPPAVTAQLAASIAQFDLLLDDTVNKFNDARWCVEQIVENKQKQEDMKLQEELERQKRTEAERRRKEEEKKNEEERKAQRTKEEQEGREKKEMERLEQERKDKARQEKEEDLRKEDIDNIMGPRFDFDMDLDKGQDINPSDILSSISYKDGKKKVDDMDLDLNNVLGGDQLLDGLNMDLLDQEFDGGANVDEEFDVDNFLNQFGND